MAVTDMIDIVLYGILIILALGFIIALLYLLRQRSLYKHYFFRELLTSSKPIGILDRAREVKEKDGTVFWKLLKSKDLINMPPNNALIPLTNGSFFVRAYDLGNMNYKYSKEDLDADALLKVKELETKIYREGKNQYFERVRRHLIDIKTKTFLNYIIDTPIAKPTPVYIFPTETHTIDFVKDMSRDVIKADERQNAYNQIKKAFEERLNSWERWGIPIVVVVALVIMISVMFIFGAELVRPIAEVHARTADMVAAQAMVAEKQADIMQIINNMVKSGQLAFNEKGGAIIAFNQSAPN